MSKHKHLFKWRVEVDTVNTKKARRFHKMEDLHFQAWKFEVSESKSRDQTHCDSNIMGVGHTHYPFLVVALLLTHVEFSAIHRGNSEYCSIREM